MITGHFSLTFLCISKFPTMHYNSEREKRQGQWVRAEGRHKPVVGRRGFQHRGRVVWAGLENVWELVSREGVSTGRSQGSIVCLGDKEQPREDEAVVDICSKSLQRFPVAALHQIYREQAVCLPSQKKQSPTWTVAFFINQNQSSLMHDGPTIHAPPGSLLSILKSHRQVFLLCKGLYK